MDKSMICPRCLKNLHHGVHTCTPTPLVRELETEATRLRAELEHAREERDSWRGGCDWRDAEITRLRAELAACRDALAKIGPYYVPSTELSDDEVNAMYAMIDAARKGEETQ